MEVHTHPGAHGKKSWKQYFWEFLMLFLAVFCGFLAENFREHQVEHQREKQFIRSIKEDITNDIYQLDSIIAGRQLMDRMMDSVIYFINDDDPRRHGSEIYYYTRWSPRTMRFYSDDRTMTQLKNAGNWRLIRNRKVSDQIAHYDNLVRTITQFIDAREESLVQILYQSIDKLFDNRVFESMVNGLSFVRPAGNPQLMLYDKSELNEFGNRMHFRKNSNYYYLKAVERLLNEAHKTIDVINHEYTPE
jgi:hypothetical protein